MKIFVSFDFDNDRQYKYRVSGFFRLVTPYVRNKVLPACT